MRAVALAPSRPAGPWVLVTAAVLGAACGLAPLAGTAALLGLAVAAVGFGSAEAGLALLLAAMLLSPEIPLRPGASGGLETGRAVTIRLDDLVVAGYCVGRLARMAVDRAARFRMPTAVARPVLAYLAVCAVSTAAGLAAGRVRPLTGTLFVLKYAEYFLVFALSLEPLSRPGRAGRFLGLFFAVAAVVCLWALTQVPAGGRISAPFEGDPEPNTLGAYVVLAGCLAAGLWLEAGRPWARWGPWLLGLFGVTLLLTLSRSSWLAAVAAAGVFVRHSRRRLWVAGACLLAAAALVAFPPPAVKERVLHTVRERSSQPQVTVAGVTLDASTSARIESWVQVARDALRHPLLGHGVTGYGFVDAQYVKLLADTGLLGLGAFLWILGSLRGRGRAAVQSPEPLRRGLGLGFLAATWGLGVHALGANTFILIRVMEPYLFAAACVVAMEPKRGEEESP
ncbi:O-antigen ligase family protein [Deferrisoma sp.]